MKPKLELLKADIRDGLNEAFADIEPMLSKPPEEVPL